MTPDENQAAAPDTASVQQQRSPLSPAADRDVGNLAQSARQNAGEAAEGLGAAPAIEREDFLIAEGDLVRLKTGGPIMMVKFKIATLLLCVWTNPQGRTQRETFAPAQLELIGQDSPAWLLALSRLAARWKVMSTF